MALGQELIAAIPSVPEYRALLAGSHAKLASIERRGKELAAADDDYRQAVTLQTALAEQYPAAPIFRFSLARPLREWGDLKRERGQLAESREVFEKGIKSFRTGPRVQSGESLLRSGSRRLISGLVGNFA